MIVIKLVFSLLCFCVSLFGKESNAKLVAEAKLAIDSKNYLLANDIYSKLASKRLMLEKKQQLFELQGDLARALVLANKRFLVSGFDRRVKILTEIHSLMARLGLYQKPSYIPKWLARKMRFSGRVDEVISKLVFYKNCLTTFFIELLVLIFWILFLIFFFSSSGRILTSIAFVAFGLFSQELYYRLIVDNPNKIGFVVAKDARLMTKPDFDDAIVIVQVPLGQRVDISQEREGAYKIATVDGSLGWIAKQAVERVA